MMKYLGVLLIGGLLAISGCHKDDPANTPIATPLKLVNSTLNGKATSGSLTNIPVSPTFVLTFSAPLDHASAQSGITFSDGTTISASYSHHDSTITFQPSAALKYLTKYSLNISGGVKSAAGGLLMTSQAIAFRTQLNYTHKFPTISDTALVNLVQQQTLKYFYDFAEPVSGMARERNSSGNTVTTGGSGFGVMALLAGINRGFITRANGIAQIKKIVTYLEKADRFHGAWSHWADGTTGKVIPFGTNDDGADLVETSYMIHGLICARQYMTSSDTVGNNLINRITKLYNDVDWNWFRKSPAENVLYWNWSPNAGFAVNVPIRGYNETLITYILAAGSSTSSIPVEVYQQGWTQSKAILNGQTYYSHILPLGQPYGGPLFFTQYSFLGFNPHVTDTYLGVDYWTQNVNQTLINHDFCQYNPGNHIAYSDSCWGVTASDNPWGYAAQSPTNDNGTISPTAALAAMPYAPAQSMKAMKFFYYVLGDKLWGSYGFYDAFNLDQNWTATSTLAIDQGPIIVMIENYRTQLFWKLFMSAPEVQAAKLKLGFQ